VEVSLMAVEVEEYDIPAAGTALELLPPYRVLVVWHLCRGRLR
jgi:hypothetical protein